MKTGGAVKISRAVPLKTTHPRKIRARPKIANPMVNLFGEDPEFRFDVGFQPEDLQLEQQQVNENKLETKVRKQFFKYTRKIENDIRVIRELVSQVGPDEELMLMSREFDSPNVILAFREEIRRIYIATWAITPAGIAALQTLGQTTEEVYVLLDKTHSYKWIFSSGAYKLLRGKVRFKFTANHSKFVAMEMIGGGV